MWGAIILVDDFLTLQGEPRDVARLDYNNVFVSLNYDKKIIVHTSVSFFPERTQKYLQQDVLGC